MSYYEKVADEHEYFYVRHHCPLESIAHFHSAQEFAFCKKGQMEITISGEKITLKENEGAFIDGFTVHTFERNLSADGYFLVAEKGYFERSFSFLNGTPARKIFLDDYCVLDEMVCCYNDKTLDCKVKKTRFYGLCNMLVSKIAEKNQFLPHPKTRQEENLCKMLEYIDKNIKEDISLLSLSKEFGYSKEHLSRLLNKVLGVGFLDYVNGLRVKEAKKLLDKKDGRSVLEIAYACGFNSANTFYRAYKKAYGISPKKV